MESDLFRYMSNIQFKDYESFIKQIDINRREMKDADDGLLCLEPKEVDIEHLQDIPNGRIYSDYKGYRFESFFYKKESKYLYVFLNGALTKPKPQFGRWSYYKYVDGSVINISDPMYEKFDKLTLGWYYGSDKENLREYVAEYVKKIADYLKVEYKNIVFYGSSGGGCAALECANHIKDSIAVSINPQIDLIKFGYRPTFEKITSYDLGNDKFGRVDGAAHIKNKRGNHILIINGRSKGDMEQLKEVCKELNVDIKYGINIFEDYIIWIYDCDLGHGSQPHSVVEFYCVYFVIEWLVHNIENKQMLCDAEALFRLVNEFWYYRGKNEVDTRTDEKSKELSFTKIRKCKEIEKEIIVWGAGNIGREFLDKITGGGADNYLNIKWVVDSNRQGLNICGIPVCHSEIIEDWYNTFVIIAVERGKAEIVDYLESKDLEYQKDFILYKDLYRA